jgi:hypothetical protein
MTLSVTALGLMTPNIIALDLLKSNILQNFAFSQQKSISTENTLLIGATTLGTMTLGRMTPSITALNLVKFSILEFSSFPQHLNSVVLHCVHMSLQRAALWSVL